MRPRARVSTSRFRQRGQALIFVTITALVMILALLVMFNMGQLTTEKMKLQNTADAAAYSAAVAQARDYNFSAYLNRGMIANDAAVAQLVGLSSWLRNYKDTFDVMLPRVDQRLAYWQKGSLYPAWKAQENALKRGTNLSGSFDSGAGVVIPLLLDINEAFMVSQKVYHYGTALTVAQTLGVDDKFNTILSSTVGFDISGLTDLIRFGDTYNVVKLNDPEASLSLLGMAGYAYNLQQWLQFTTLRNPLGPHGSESRDNGYHDRDCKWDTIFGCAWWGSWYWVSNIERKNYPTAPSDDGPAKDRMAGVVLASRDEFTRDRSKDWNLPWLIDPSFILRTSNPVAPPGWFWKKLYHDGQTVLDDAKMPGGPGSPGAWGYRKSDSWNNHWLGTDSTSLRAGGVLPVFFWPIGNVWINAPVLWRWSSDSDLGGSDASGNAAAGEQCGPEPSIWDGLAIFFGGGITGDKPSCRTGPIWKAKVASRKDALRPYRDVTNIAQATPTANQNWSSPPLVVEVEKQTKKITTSPSVTRNAAGGGVLGIGRADGAVDPPGCGLGNAARNAPPVTAAFGTGNLDLGDGTANNCMRALAKAEAYFSRPTDLFPRDDGLMEYGSLYSPYWQARLVPNSTTEQFVSLGLHGVSDWKSFGAGAASAATSLFNLAK